MLAVLTLENRMIGVALLHRQWANEQDETLALLPWRRAGDQLGSVSLPRR